LSRIRGKDGRIEGGFSACPQYDYDALQSPGRGGESTGMAKEASFARYPTAFSLSLLGRKGAARLPLGREGGEIPTSLG
jgi:hypothetical protein